MKFMHIVALALVVALFAVSFWASPLLPDKMASHWNIEGDADGHMAKGIGTYLMPIISLVLLAMFIILPIIDPLRKNYKKFQKEYDGMIVVLIGFFLYIHLLSIGFNLGYSFNMTGLLAPAFAVLLYYLGIVISKAKRNWFVGIRTPWTLSSERVWKKTHKITGKLFKLAGFVALIGIAYPSHGLMLAVGVLIAASVFSIVYSYLEFRKEKRR